ncbi:hypothetical protein ACHAXA_001798 [Cyclostephanos tholiformis]|uniref:Uncharacterized protein n=1 Tax=Cyclostephanos tholiformis TaxID=382380 RepID=A0ABD3SDV4_9STRA
MRISRPQSVSYDRRTRPCSSPHPNRRGALTMASLCIGFIIIGLVGYSSTAILAKERTTLEYQVPIIVGPPGHLFDPVTMPTECARTNRRRVIDMTLINNDLSILEIRLNELWNFVDVFFIAESTVPFKPDAKSKPLYLTTHWEDFRKFHSKMVLYVIPPEISEGTGARVDLVDFRPNFKIQTAQREEVWRKMKERLNPTRDDLIIIADTDEIPRPGAIEKLACAPPTKLPRTPICLESGVGGFYYYNYLCHIKTNWNVKPLIVQSNWKSSMPVRTRLTNTSTHCSSCFGSLDEYHIKSVSNSEPTRDPLQTNNASILERIRGCKDFWLRPTQDKTMELRETVDSHNIPIIVTAHPERWPHLVGKGPLYDSTHDNDSEPMTRTNVEAGSSTINVPVCSTAQNTCVRPFFPSPKTVACPPQGKLGTSSTGSYILPKNFVYRFDQKFANAILNNVTTLGSSVLELGAGLGCYTYYFNNSGQLTQIIGYEGASNVFEMSGGLVKRADLTVKQDFGQRFDWVVCLEVAEHIPEEYESIFVENIISNSPKGIVLSWALPTQPGSGHVNGKTNDYVIALMESKGYDFDIEKTTFLRRQAELGWFQRTTMVYYLRNQSKL